MEIVRVDFKKGEGNKTLLGDGENIEKLIRWVLPIIEKNEGWGTGTMTKDDFLANPEKYQDEIDATVWGNVHILVDEGVPVGLLEFSKTTMADKGKKKHQLLDELLGGKGLDDFEFAVAKKLDRNKLSEIRSFLRDKPIYTSIGLVLRSDLQGKRSGLSEKLYSLIADGICIGWTSNPVIVRQRRKLFKNTLYFPPYGEFPSSVEEWAVCLYVYLYRLDPSEKDEVQGFKFGTMRSVYFVEERGEEYLRIARGMVESGKLGSLDGKRIEYVLGRKSCAAAIVSWN